MEEFKKLIIVGGFGLLHRNFYTAVRFWYLKRGAAKVSSQKKVKETKMKKINTEGLTTSEIFNLVEVGDIVETVASRPKHLKIEKKSKKGERQSLSGYGAGKMLCVPVSGIKSITKNTKEK